LRNLVTGGSGFLGSHLVDALVARGESVRILVRPTSDTSHLESLDVELIYGDLTDARSLAAATRGVERVYHSAALASDWGGWASFQAANVTGTGNLLAAALEAGVDRFIHISTTDVYGHPGFPAGEATPFQTRGWPYGDTKIESEQLVWSFYRDRGLPATIIRPVNIYGPRSVSFVLDIIDLLKAGGMVHIGWGRLPAGLAYVGNVVDALLLAADSDISLGQAYNVCDGSDVSWRAYTNRLAEIIGAPYPRFTIPYRPAYIAGWAMEKLYGALRREERPLLTRMAVELFGTYQGFPIDKARRELGYEPAVDFETGMDRVAAWLEQIGAK